jgi:hypothetical protein
MPRNSLRYWRKNSEKRAIILPALQAGALRAGNGQQITVNVPAQHPTPRTKNPAPSTYKYKEVKMAQIILKTNTPEKAANVLKEALEIEASRLKYSLNIAKKRLKRFETKYNISSEKFINEWSADDLKGKDLEYVEWAGEYQLFSRLSERLVVLKSIENVA